MRPVAGFVEVCCEAGTTFVVVSMPLSSPGMLFTIVIPIAFAVGVGRVRLRLRIRPSAVTFSSKSLSEVGS